MKEEFMSKKKSANTFYIIAFSLLILVIIFEAFTYIGYLKYLKEGNYFDLGMHLKSNYTNGFGTALKSIILDFLSLLLFFLLPFVIRFAMSIQVTLYVYIAYGLNIVIGITVLLFAYLRDEPQIYSSSDYGTTTIKTKDDLCSGEEISQTVKTPQDKADAANFWFNILTVALVVAFPYVLFPTLIYFILKEVPFLKGKWYLTLLITLLLFALAIFAGYGFVLLIR